MGKIHVSNLKRLGADVASIDKEERTNDQANINLILGPESHKSCKEWGAELVVVSFPV